VQFGHFPVIAQFFAVELDFRAMLAIFVSFEVAWIMQALLL